MVRTGWDIGKFLNSLIIKKEPEAIFAQAPFCVPFYALVQEYPVIDIVDRHLAT